MAHQRIAGNTPAFRRMKADNWMAQIIAQLVGKGRKQKMESAINAALKDKGCDTALDLTKQVLGKVKK